jgi:hypothetical protein
MGTLGVAGPNPSRLRPLASDSLLMASTPIRRSPRHCSNLPTGAVPWTPALGPSIRQEVGVGQVSSAGRGLDGRTQYALH